jgi:hypothetical protein
MKKVAFLIVLLSFLPIVARAQYCPSNSTIYDEEWISWVGLNTGSKSSTGSSYSDYTTPVFTSLTKGMSYIIYVNVTTISSWQECVRVWIDYNQNFVFEDTEMMDLGCFVTYPIHTFSTNFTVPIDAKEGNTRMRVSHEYFTPPTSCESFYFGEVEDYTVKIVSPVTPVAPCEICDVAQIPNNPIGYAMRGVCLLANLIACQYLLILFAIMYFLFIFLIVYFKILKR